MRRPCALSELLREAYAWIKTQRKSSLFPEWVREQAEEARNEKKGRKR